MSSHTDEEGGRCKEETISEYLLLMSVTVLALHITGFLFQLNGSLSYVLVFFTILTHYSGSPPMRIREVKSFFLDFTWQTSGIAIFVLIPNPSH